MSTPLFWIGIRESEIADCNLLFCGSITIFGSGCNNNNSFDKTKNLRFDYNYDNDEWILFVQEQINKICCNIPDVRFLLYFPEEVDCYGEEVKKRTICQNDTQLIELMGNKQRTRNWLSNTVPILPHMTHMGYELSYAKMCQAFSNYTAFVLQEEYSCGGSGTYFVDSLESGKKYINKNMLYSVSPYIERNVSPNVHLVIYSDEILILPPSIQLFAKESDRFHYCGSDFVMFQYLPEKIKDKLYSYSNAIGERLKLAGYRGVCGIDFLCDRQELYFMEINARFQSSSFLINKAFRENNIPCSLQALHIDAFENKKCSYKMHDFTIDYSFWGYSYEPKYENQLHYFHSLHTNSDSNEVMCVDDGLNWEMKLEKGTYLFKSIFKGNIASLSPKFSCQIHSNIDVSLLYNFPNELTLENAMQWKISLLNHGVRIHTDVLIDSLQKGGINFEEFGAVDMVINDCIYINVPYCQNRSQLSPFEIINNDKNSYYLSFIGKVVANVSLRSIDKMSKMKTTSGITFDNIAYMSNDRLRIYHRAGCFFQENKCGCGFCDIDASAKTFSFNDIKEVFQAYEKKAEINHFLIGGGSESPDSDFSNIIKIANYIRSRSEKPIYLMSLPPSDPCILLQLKQAGITEVAFNIEIYDRILAQKYMPGKGLIALETYISILKESTRLWGCAGNVRSIFVVGLEPVESLLSGIEHLCSMGVSPILSLFKPIAGTPLSHLLAPTDREIFDVYVKVSAICKKYGVPLGPLCHFCEDNTLKISFR